MQRIFSKNLSTSFCRGTISKFIHVRVVYMRRECTFLLFSVDELLPQASTGCFFVTRPGHT